MNKLFLCLKSGFVGLIAAAVVTPGATAQSGRFFEKTEIFPEGRLEIGALGLATKYVGEFTDNNIGEAFGLTTRYTFPFLPELSLGARYTHGYLRYDRRYQNRFGGGFSEQFPEEDFPGAKASNVERQTKVDSYDLVAYINLFPHQSLNYYVFAGGGMLAFQPQDVIENPIEVDGSRRNYPTLTEDKQYNAHAVGGLGVDYYLTPSLSFGAQMSFHMLTTDDLDGFAGKVEGGKSAMDGYGDFGLKLSYNIFTDNDADNDGLINEEEALIGTNPYSIDSDEDGVQDFEEVRTFASNPLVQDSDNDGLNDSEEAYKLNSSLTNIDSDSDGLNDFDEARLYRTNPTLPDTDGDGLTDAAELVKGSNSMLGDTDGDGVVDREDYCPTVYGLADNNGCPVTLISSNNADFKHASQPMRLRDTVYVFREVKTIKENESYTPYGINFEPNKAVIREESEPILEDVAKWLRNSPSINVEIRGHTDADGTSEANLKLSEARAHAVRIYLIGQGVEALRLTVKGLGEFQPIASNTEARGKARNRRIEFYVQKSSVQQALGENNF